MTPDERAAALRKYMDDAGPVVWGESDCCAWPLRWAEKSTGKRFPLPRYSSRAEAEALVSRAGGLPALAESILSALMPTSTPICGDVGVVKLSDRDVGVIFCGNGLAAWRCEQRGAIFIRPKTVLAAWSV